MPRFQLLVKEPGKEPHVVELGEPQVVGRSKAVDITVEDEEVGRKQFEILVTSGFVILKGLGKTNPTRVDDSLIQPGEQTTLAMGATIRVGKSEFVVQDAEATERGVAPQPQPEQADQTIVGFNPAAAASPPAPTAPKATPDRARHEETNSAGDDFGMTMAGGFRPGAAPPGGSARAPGAPEQPPADTPPADAPPPAAASQTEAADDYGMTMAGGFRPGAAPAAAPGATPAASPDAQPAAADVVDSGMTMIGGVRPGTAPRGDTESTPGQQQPPPPADLPIEEVQAWRPRLFVKGEGFKRNLVLSRSTSVVGRAEDADVRLDHASLSDRHAEVRFDGSRWTLVACSSSAPTLVDGQAVTHAPVDLLRNSLISVGALRVVFLSADPRAAARGDREEQRALDLLAKSGQLDAHTVREIRRMVRDEGGQSVAEVVLRDTPVTATDWASAVAGARARPSLLRRLLRILSLGLL